MPFLTLACAVSLPEDDRDDSFFAPGGKGDGPGAAQEGSPLALAVLRVANESNQAKLEDASIGSAAVKAILAYRSGPDSQGGSLDDGVLTSLAALDALDYVGSIAFERLADRARKQGFVAYEEWKAGLTKDGSGAWIVDYDLPISSEKRLRETYAALGQSSDRSVVHHVDGRDAIWGESQKLQLTYCVSDAFGDDKAEVMSATAEAARSWMEAANIRFVHASEHDESCYPSNPAVVFDIRPGADHLDDVLGRAFFPNAPREERSILLGDSALGRQEPPTLAGIMRHHLGHALGLGHEHAREEMGAECYDNPDWRPLTDYDRTSVMHYPNCNGTGDWSLHLSELDKQGVAQLYGPTEGTEVTSGPKPQPGVERRKELAGTLKVDEAHEFGPFVLLAETPFVARLSGSGDADLYVRWGAPPSEDEYDCRPFSDSSLETCSWTVPAGVSEVYVMVKAATAASEYILSISYRADVANLLANASFEEGEDDAAPPGWTVREGTFVTRSSDTAWDGERLGAFVFSSGDENASVMSRCFLLAGASSLTISGQARTAGAVNESQIGLWVELFSDRDCASSVETAQQERRSLKERSQWERILFQVGDLPPAATAARIVIVAAGTSSKPLQIDAMAAVLDEEAPAEPPGRPRVNAGRWEPIAAGPSAVSGHTAIWTGRNSIWPTREMIISGGVLKSGTSTDKAWAYTPELNHWREIHVMQGPGQAMHSAVWTGLEMLIFGGLEDHQHLFQSYRPDQNAWNSLGQFPSKRSAHSAVWTGSEMIVWGGSFSGVANATGARYNPAIGKWTHLETSGAPSPRYGHGAVWTGKEMIIWGGQTPDGTSLYDGASFDPTSNQWRPLWAKPEMARKYHVTVWTDRELVVWGGETSDSISRNDGVVYDPRSGTWTELGQTGEIPSPRSRAAGVWTGTEMIIWGGWDNTARPDGARFVPTSADF